MFKRIPTAFLLFLFAVIGSEARAEHTRMTYPTFVGVEAFGKAMAYGVQYDRVVSDDLVAGVAYGSVSLRTPAGADTGTSTGLIPVYMHYYFAREQGSFFGMLGATFVSNSSGAEGKVAKLGGVEFSSNPVLPTIGIGFEERGDTGFIFRVAGYGLLGKTYSPWFGFSFGYGF